jgi:hypothetical protein
MQEYQIGPLHFYRRHLQRQTNRKIPLCPEWHFLAVEVESFERLGLPYDTSDRDLWQVCQQRNIVLITANRNDEGPDSLVSTIRDLNEPSSLPVLTIADPTYVLTNQDYAERVAIQVLEYLLELDNFRGTGRLFCPVNRKGKRFLTPFPRLSQPVGAGVPDPPRGCRPAGLDHRVGHFRPLRIIA